MEFPWTKTHPDLDNICKLFNRTELLDPIRWSYRPLPTVIQNGPQCGLVALAMLIGNPSEELVNKIFEYAKHKEYTCNGEMYSVHYMHALAEEFLPNSQSVVLGDFTNRNIIHFLLSGGRMLVPYDQGLDFSPAYCNGHRAHWCAVSGVIETVEEVFVIAKQGKSKTIGIWPLNNLAKSNSQLREFARPPKGNFERFVLPEGGISGPLGLRGKCLLISDKN